MSAKFQKLVCPSYITWLDGKQSKSELDISLLRQQIIVPANFLNFNSLKVSTTYVYAHLRNVIFSRR